MFNYYERFAYNKGYRVVDGCVISPNGVTLKLFNNKGYLRFTIDIDGKKVKVRVHRLVAYQKYGDILYDDGVVVRHLNGNKSDFSNSNIAIGSSSDNMMDIPKYLRVQKSLYGASFVRRFCDDDIISMRQLHKNGYTYKYICDMYNVSKSTLSYIINKKTYKYV